MLAVAVVQIETVQGAKHVPKHIALVLLPFKYIILSYYIRRGQLDPAADQAFGAADPTRAGAHEARSGSRPANGNGCVIERHEI
jgi:hypothetical protein